MKKSEKAMLIRSAQRMNIYVTNLGYSMIFICSVNYLLTFTDTKMYISNYTLIGLLVLGVNKGPLIRPVLKVHLIDTLLGIIPTI